MNQDFQSSITVASNNIERLAQNVSQIQRMVTQIGTPQDSDSLRKSLHKNIQDTNALAKNINKQIADLSHIPPPYNEFDQRKQKLQKEKIMDEFSKVLNTFQATQRNAASKEKASVARAKANFGNTSGQPSKLPFEDEAFGSMQQKQTHISMEEDVNISELREREASIRKLEADINDVNQIFRDLGMLVHEQGDMLDSIEANVETANVQVEQGNTQLKQARRYQVAARKKMCIIIGILVGIVTVLALIIWGVSR